MVEIDNVSGDLKVLGDKMIDADKPPRFHLYYIVSATDCPENNEKTDCYTTDGNVKPLEIFFQFHSIQLYKYYMYVLIYRFTMI